MKYGIHNLRISYLEGCSLVQRVTDRRDKLWVGSLAGDDGFMHVKLGPRIHVRTVAPRFMRCPAPVPATVSGISTGVRFNLKELSHIQTSSHRPTQSQRQLRKNGLRGPQGTMERGGGPGWSSSQLERVSQHPNGTWNSLCSPRRRIDTAPGALWFRARQLSIWISHLIVRHGLSLWTLALVFVRNSVSWRSHDAREERRRRPRNGLRGPRWLLWHMPPGTSLSEHDLDFALAIKKLEVLICILA